MVMPVLDQSLQRLPPVVNGRLRDELLSGEIFYSLREIRVVIEPWRKHYNTKRPHSASSEPASLDPHATVQ